VALAVTMALAAGSTLLVLTATSGAHPYRASSAVLRGTASRLAGMSRRVGTLDPARQIKLALPLALRNSAALDRLVTGQYSPDSPSYHRFLTPSQFGRRFGAPPAEIRRAVAALRRLGFRVALPRANHLYLSAAGTVRAVERTFGVRLDRFRIGTSHTFFANATDIRLPASLRGLVTGVVGLDNAARPVSHLVRAPRTPARERGLVGGSTARQGVDGGATPCAAARAAGGYTAPDLAQAYDYNGMYAQGLHGEGMRAALLEFDDYHDSNVRGMERCYGVRTPVSRRLVDGGVGGPPEGGEAEDMADITTILELDPKLAHLYVYEAPITGGAAIFDEGTAELDLYNAFVSDDKATVLSASWGYCEALQSASYDQLFARLAEEAAAQGQQIFDASGDSGAVDCLSSEVPTEGSLSVEQEGATPWVTSVGGTDLGRKATLRGSRVHDEDTWNDGGAGGGGQSNVWAMPSWQASYLAAAHDRVPGAANDCGAPAGQLCRMVPDISMNADPLAGGAFGGGPTPPQFSTSVPPDMGSPGDNTYCATANCSFTGTPTHGVGSWYPIGGTSLAAPTAAAAAVLWDQAAQKHGLGRLGLVNPSLYRIASSASRYRQDFHDVTTDTNSDQYDTADCPPGCNPHHLYKAAKGYDMASGLGSVDVAQLGADLVKQALVIHLTPSTVRLFGYVGGPTTTQPVSVTGGPRHGSYKATSTASWLTVHRGHASGSLRWHVNPRGLTAGTRQGRITVRSQDGSTSTLTVIYKLGPRARISVSPRRLRFSERAISSSGASARPGCGSTTWNDELKGQLTSSSDHTAVDRSTRRVLRIFNRGASGSTLHYEASFHTFTSSWLTQDLNPHNNPQGFQTRPSPPLVPSSGAVKAGASAAFKLASIGNANTVGGYPALNQGTYRGVVNIRDLADPRTLVKVPVTLVLGNGKRTPRIAASPRSISVTLARGQTKRVKLVLSNASRTCGYAYSLQITRPFVRVSPYLMSGTVGATPASSAPKATDTGHGNGVEPLTISAKGLANGVYHDTVLVQSQNAGHNPTRVRITLRVSPPRRRHGRRRAARVSGFTG
jgi:Pro-kumamolisin, activation domain/Subtilase family